MVPSLLPVVLGGVTTGLDGVTRRFKGAQRSSFHIWMHVKKELKLQASVHALLAPTCVFVVIYMPLDEYNTPSLVFVEEIYLSFTKLERLN